MRYFICLILCLIVCGPSWFLVKFQISHMSPIMAVGLRMFIAGILLEMLARFRSERPPQYKFKHVALSLLQGVTMYAANFWLCYAAVAYMASGLVAVVVSTMIIPNIIMGRIFLKNPITLNACLGAVCGLLGVAFIFGEQIAGFDTESREAITGLALAFTSTFISVTGTILTGKLAKDGFPTLYITSRGMIVAGIVSMAVARFGYNESITWTSDPWFWVSLLYLACILSTYLNTFYTYLVKTFGAGQASFLWILTPAVSLTISSMFEDYQWSIGAVIGLLAIIFGGVIINFGDYVRKKFSSLFWKEKLDVE